MNSMDLKFLDVEDRPVILVTLSGKEHAFVFNTSGWTESQGLLGKIKVMGATLTQQSFQHTFPDADLTQLPFRHSLKDAK